MPTDSSVIAYTFLTRWIIQTKLDHERHNTTHPANDETVSNKQTNKPCHGTQMACRMHEEKPTSHLTPQKCEHPPESANSLQLRPPQKPNDYKKQAPTSFNLILTHAHTHAHNTHSRNEAWHHQAFVHTILIIVVMHRYWNKPIFWYTDIKNKYLQIPRYR